MSLSLFAVVLRAQFSAAPFSTEGPEHLVSVHGDLIAPDHSRVDCYYIELQLAGMHYLVPRIPVSFGGRFVAGQVPPGTYEVRILDLHGNLVKRDIAVISAAQNELTLQLPPTRGEQVSGPNGTVSMARLAHKVPPKASKEFARAVKAKQAGDREAAIEHFERAVEIDPEFAEAHNNLGACYLEKSDFARATTEFGRALEIDPDFGPALMNLGSLLVQTKQYAEAETVARRAERVEPDAPARHLILATALYGQGKYTDEALSNYREASRRYASASLATAHILLNRGDLKGAALYLHRYLDAGEERQRRAATDLLGWVERSLAASR